MVGISPQTNAGRGADLCLHGNRKFTMAGCIRDSMMRKRCIDTKINIAIKQDLQ